MKSILITGGSGFIGKKLSDYFIKKNYKVFHLSKSGKIIKDIQSFQWDPEKKYISESGKEILQQVDAVIHLAGKNIAEQQWNESFKKEIINSRVDSTSFLCELLNYNQNQKRPEVVIFASATGYYGDRGSEILTEESNPGKGFLAETCKLWEQASINLHPEIRKVHIRIGIVLDKEEGSLPKMLLPMKFFLGSIPGNGKQFLSWIHIQDLIRIFDFVLENNNAKGVYNGTAPHPVTIEEFYKVASKLLNRPIFLPNIPEFLIRFILGEMSKLVLDSACVLPKRLLDENFEFKYKNISSALDDLIL
ncbi:MAG: TIGR01777 family oxidoreductase [Leptonema sp. (in: bacteria)]